MILEGISQCWFLMICGYMQRWKIQAEANDEVERLLSSEPASSEEVLDI